MLLQVAPLLTSYNPNAVSVLNILQGPGAGHLLGTDGAGRDVGARLLYGARCTLAGALLATVVAAVLGIASGLVAGYYGKWFGSAASWVTTLLMALPGIVVLLAARSVLGPSLWTVMIIFGVLLVPAFYRLVCVAVSGVRNDLFVDAARVRVVDNVSLDIPRGEVHGLIGESGSGKTQTAWSVLRLLAAGGEILEGSIRFERGGSQPGAEREDAGHTGRAHRLYPPGTHVQPRPVVHHRQPADRADAD